MFSKALKILLLACGLFVSAQVNRFPGQWVGDLFLVENMLTKTAVYLIDEHNIIRKEIPSITGITEFPVPQGVRAGELSVGWHNEGLHAMTFPRGAKLKDANGNLFRSFTFAKWQDDEWHYLGSYNTPHTRMLSQAIPCDNDKFIFISHETDIAGSTGSSRTPFVRMTLNAEKKQLSVTSSIDHGQDDLREHMSNANCFGQACDSNIIITGSYATLLNFKTGLYWIFSLESASLKKAGNIFKKVTPEMIAKDGFTDAILCAHPEKDGTILISAQLEESFTTQPDYKAEMEELWEQNRVGEPDATMTPKDWLELYRNREKKVKEQNPWIVWYRIYPGDGKVEKVMPPEGAAIDREGGANDIWRPMPDGSVKMGRVQLKREEAKPEKQPEKQESKTQDKQS